MSFSSEKLKLTVSLTPELDEELRVFAAKNRKQLSEVVEAALSHCLFNESFIKSITTK